MTVQPVSTVTFGGVALTKLVGLDAPASGERGRTEVWYLKSPTASTANIVITLAGSNTADIAAGSMVVYDADLTNTFAAYNTASSTTTTNTIDTMLSGTLTNQLVFDAVGQNGNTMVANLSQTNQLYKLNIPAAISVSTKAGINGSTQMSWITGTNTTYASIVVAVNPISNTGSDTMATRLKVENSGNVTIANNLGIGAAPTRKLDLYTSDSNVTAPALRLQQAGSGDAVMEYSANGKSYFVGVDTSDSTKFKISSSTQVTGTTGNVGPVSPYNFTGTTTDTGNRDFLAATQITVGTSDINVTSLSLYLTTPAGGTIKMAIYNDAGNTPGTLVVAGTTDQAAVSNWNTYPITASLEANTRYFIVYRVSSNSMVFGNSVNMGSYNCFLGTGTNSYAQAFPSSMAATSCEPNRAYTVYASYSVDGSGDSFTGTLFSLGDTGDALFKSNTASTTAFRIQNSSNVSLFQVDSSLSRVYIGNTSADSTGTLLVVDTKNTATDPSGLNGALYYNSVNNTFRCHEGQRGWQDCLGVPKPNTRRWTYILPNGDTVGVGSTAQGDQLSGTGTLSEIAATSTEPVVLNFASGNVSGNTATAIGNPIYNVSANPMLQAYIAIPTTSSARVWSGLTDVTMTASASPTGNYAAFRFDTSASDTNYKCVTNDNGAVATVVDSGVAPGTAGRRLEINIISGSRVEFKIDGAVVCGSVITDLPAAGTNLRQNHTITTLTGTSRALKLGWSYVESDK
jgi:hypothetical protein